MIKQILEKWACKHRWEIHYTTEVFGEAWNGENKIIRRAQTLICEDCGKIKKIIL